MQSRKIFNKYRTGNFFINEHTKNSSQIHIHDLLVFESFSKDKEIFLYIYTNTKLPK